MNFNNIIQLFTPKDKVFFSLFEQVAFNVAEMGKLLREVVTETDFDKRSSIINKVTDLEHKNDDVTHEIFTQLGKNFITPFDREDIHYLATALDDICDYIYTTAKKINLYKVNPNDSAIQKMAEIIEKGADSIKIAVLELRNLKNMQNITDAIIRVKSYENQADDIFDMCVEQLFESETDIKMLIKKREIYKVMEIVTDKFEDAANVMESIVVKYA